MVWSDKAREAAKKARTHGSLMHNDSAQHKEQAKMYMADVEKMQATSKGKTLGSQGSAKIEAARDLARRHEVRAMETKQSMAQFVKSREKK